VSLQFRVDTGRNMTVAEVAEDARVAEECGFDQITLVDQQNLDRDVYLMMAGAAQATKRIKVGHGVTVCGTRHPSVTANATATLDDMYPGRIFLGIGAGGSALRSMGGKARPQQEFREYVQFIKRYMAGEEAEWLGAKMHSAWIKKPVPIVMAAAGPQSCRMAGELGDAAMISVGVHPEVVKWRIELIREGAERAGRDPSKLEIWLCCTIVLAESRAAAFREAAAKSSRAVWVTLGMVKSPEVEELHRRLRRVMPDLDELIAEGKRAYDEYDEYEHELLDSRHSQFMTQRMIDFTHLVGTPEDICERLAVLQELGVSNISGQVYTLVDRHGMMRTIAQTIIPRFR
jgi:5,10-methylenetetrahydromethanopterin reductase